MTDIKDADLPANPLSGDAYIDFAHAYNSGGGYNPECQGLTKREAFAMAAMQGILSNCNYEKMIEKFGHTISYHSVTMADALLKELSK